MCRLLMQILLELLGNIFLQHFLQSREYILREIANKVPAESVHDQEVSQHACDAHDQDDDTDGVVSVVRDVYRWKWVAWNHGPLKTGKQDRLGSFVELDS